MSRPLAIAFTFVFCLAASVAHAEVAWSLSAYAEEIVVFSEGDARLLTTTLVAGPGVTIPLSARWSVYLEISAATAVSDFAPAPRVVVAPTLEVSKKFLLGFSALYQLNPPYEGAATSHLMAVGVVPLVPLSRHVAVGLVISPGVTLGSGRPEWGLTLAPFVQLTL